MLREGQEQWKGLKIDIESEEVRVRKGRGKELGQGKGVMAGVGKGEVRAGEGDEVTARKGEEVSAGEGARGSRRRADWHS